MTTSRLTPSDWMYLDGNEKVTSDDIIKTARGWVKVHPNGQEELIHALKTIGDVAPTVSSVTNHADGTYDDTEVLSFTLSFSEAVDVVTTGGTPSIQVYTEAGTPFDLDYASGTGGTDLVFSGSVSGIADGDLVVVEEVFLNGGTIQDSAGQDIDVRFPDDYVQPAIDFVTV